MGGEGGGVGGGPSEDAPGVGTTTNKQSKDAGVLHVLLCVYAVLPKRILILATHPQKFCCLYLFDFFPLTFLTA